LGCGQYVGMTQKLPPHMNPMSPAEVHELLSATLHGDLPRDTMQRVLATLAEWKPIVERAGAEAVARLPAPAGYVGKLRGRFPRYVGENGAEYAWVTRARNATIFTNAEAARNIGEELAGGGDVDVYGVRLVKE
ncbi:MAG: hypothetical protein ACPG1A_14260, partial [Halioglobus sp.]